MVEPHNGLADIETIGKQLHQTRAIALSWINYTTGQVNPIAEISKFCKSKNIRLLVDATQALGVFPIDLTSIHIDFLWQVYSGVFVRELLYQFFQMHL